MQIRRLFFSSLSLVIALTLCLSTLPRSSYADGPGGLANLSIYERLNLEAAILNHTSWLNLLVLLNANFPQQPLVLPQLAIHDGAGYGPGEPTAFDKAILAVGVASLVGGFALVAGGIISTGELEILERLFLQSPGFSLIASGTTSILWGSGFGPRYTDSSHRSSPTDSDDGHQWGGGITQSDPHALEREQVIASIHELRGDLGPEERAAIIDTFLSTAPEDTRARMKALFPELKESIVDKHFDIHDAYLQHAQEAQAQSTDEITDESTDPDDATAEMLTPNAHLEQATAHIDQAQTQIEQINQILEKGATEEVSEIQQTHILISKGSHLLTQGLRSLKTSIENQKELLALQEDN